MSDASQKTDGVSAKYIRSQIGRLTESQPEEYTPCLFRATPARQVVPVRLSFASMRIIVRVLAPRFRPRGDGNDKAAEM